jgi:hypothetical protein
MQQPPDPYPQFQQPHNAPTSSYTQPPSTPGQFQYPPPYNYNQPPKRASGFRHWFRTRSRRTKIGLGCGTIIAALLLCICAASVYGSTTVGTIPTPTPTTGHVTILNPPTVNIPTETPTLPPSPTQKPTPIPTVKPTSKPQPTQPPVHPTPTQPACQAVNNNPWCYNFSPGKLIYVPPSGFCNYFNCIPTFYGSDDPGDGYIVQCNDGTYSQSGGESGACSHHGGVMRPLYSH